MSNRAKMISKIFSCTMILSLLLLSNTITSYANTGYWENYNEIWVYHDFEGGPKHYRTWLWIDVNNDDIYEHYFFDGDGALLTNAVAPNGYYVNKDGVLEINGVVQTISGKKIQQNGVMVVPTEKSSSIDQIKERFKFLDRSSATEPNGGGYWADQSNLTWQFFDNGDSYTVGRGPVFADQHPEITDPEYYIGCYCYLPGEEINYQNSKEWGMLSDAEYSELKKFVNSFDWIHSDELTRAQKVYERIAKGQNGNYYSRADNDQWCVLIQKHGICDDFAREYSRLCQLVGLQCEYYTPSEGNAETIWGHAANLLTINGQCIIMDPTQSFAFFDNGNCPCDYNIEKNMTSKVTYQLSDYKDAIRNQLMNELEAGRISNADYEQKIRELYW